MWHKKGPVMLLKPLLFVQFFCGWNNLKTINTVADWNLNLRKLQYKNKWKLIHDIKKNLAVH